MVALRRFIIEQLKQDNDLKKEVRDYNNHISSKIEKLLDRYLIDFYKKRVIWYLGDEEIEIYCPRCLEIMENGGYCKKCNHNYEYNSVESKKMLVGDKYAPFDIFDDDWHKYFLYYFNIESTNVVLYRIHYVIKIDITDKSFTIKRKEIYKLYIEKDRVYLSNNEYHTFDFMIRADPINKVDGTSLIYKENLDILKGNDLYKYSYLWELKDFFNITDYYYPTFENIVVYPLLHKEFEYLIKLGFYSMALLQTDKIKFNKNFKNTFKVEKSKLKYFDNRFLLLEHLNLIEELNIKSAKKLTNLKSEFESVKDIDSVVKYIKKNKLNNKDIFNYLDYLKVCNRFIYNYEKYGEREKINYSIFYPKDYRNRKKEFYDYFKDEIKDINDWYQKMYNILKMNYYEDDEYIIRPLKSLEDLFNEAKTQRNCLENYIDFECKGSYQLYFMRKKNDINTSLVTIEIKNNKIFQALAKFNKEPEDKIKKILKLWESRLVKVEFER